MAKKQFIPTIKKSAQSIELLKVHSTSIEGPLESTDGDYYYKVEIEQADLGDVIRMSHSITRHFFVSQAGLICKKADECMEQGKVLKMSLVPTILELNATLDTPYEVDGYNWVDKDPYLFTLLFADERPRNVLLTETVMQGLIFRPIQKQK